MHAGVPMNGGSVDAAKRACPAMRRPFMLNGLKRFALGWGERACMWGKMRACVRACMLELLAIRLAVIAVVLAVMWLLLSLGRRWQRWRRSAEGRRRRGGGGGGGLQSWHFRPSCARSLSRRISGVPPMLSSTLCSTTHTVRRATQFGRQRPPPGHRSACVTRYYAI
jgi:hypothetical protein